MTSKFHHHHSKWKYKIYTTIVLVFAGLSIKAQTPNWEWIKSANGGNNNVGAYSTATDNQGNIYVTGSYNADSITFGAFTIVNAGGQALSGSNGIDYYLVKYDGMGNVLWAKGAGGLYDDYGQSVATDAAGNVFVIGFFSSDTINFGTNSLVNIGVLPNVPDIFIVKYDATGNVVWAKKTGGIFGDRGYGIAADASGNVFVTGSYDSQITFGSTVLNSGGSYNCMFIVKYDTGGNVLWANSANSNSSSNSFGFCTSADAAGNVYVAGSCANGPVNFGTTTITNSGSDDVFIAKYDSSGVLQWVKKAGNVGNESAKGIKADATGNVYLTGQFRSASLAFGNDTLTNANSTGSISDIFIAKYSNTGNIIWTKSAGGSSTDEGQGITVDAIGNVYSSCRSGSQYIAFGTDTIINTSGYQMIIAKYTASGNLIWTKAATTAGFGTGNSVATDAAGNIYLAGIFGYAGNFDSDTLYANGAGIYLAKLNPTLVSIETPHGNDKFNIYPNPSTGIFTISGNYNLINIEVYNLMGELILSQGNVGEIDLNAFPSGLYLARVNGESVIRLLKE